MNPFHILLPRFLKYVKILSSYLCPGIPSDLFLSDFVTKLHFSLSSTCARCPTQFTPHGLITLIIYSEQYKSRQFSPSYCYILYSRCKYSQYPPDVFFPLQSHNMTRTMQRQIRNRHNPYILIRKMRAKPGYKPSHNHNFLSLFLCFYTVERKTKKI
jgi:hypothetical protein